MITEILATLEKAWPVLVVIFVTVFCLILLTRLILTFLLNQALKRYQALKKLTKKPFAYAKKNYLKEEDELSLKKDEIPRAHSAVKAEMKEKGGVQSGSYELMVSKEQEQDKQELNQTSIVDVVKPIGFWTSMILGQKLTYLIQSAQTINKRGDKGFWASMIEAKERQAGRQHARGR